MSDTVIKVENLSKHYNLGTIGSGTLYRDIQSFWARLRAKEDPNRQIGTWDVAQMDHNNSFWALKDVSFEVKQGDVVGIIGRNGAGKSTLLKILSRVTGPTSGNIKIKGRVASLLEVGTGFHPELTGRENVYLNGTILGMRKSEIDKKFDEIVAFAEIEKFIDTPVKRYSSGMYVRLAFAVAAHLDPEILIVDEVLAVGDAEFQKKCLGKMQEVGNAGRTVLFVSHNMGAVRRLCNKGILLSQGQLNYIGETEQSIVNYFSTCIPSEQSTEVREGKIAFLSWSIEGINSVSGFSTPSRNTCTFIFRICSKTVIKNARVGFLLLGLHGEKIIAATSLDNGGQCFDFYEGQYTLRVSVRLPIRAGTYSMNIHIKSGGDMILSWDCTPDLVITPNIITHLAEQGQGLLNEKIVFQLENK